ncbi:efflux RND transporter periplasmic adaptor subunit [Roseibium aestuarii]|uniref:Efflux RND transporter periplasmic adaptor subunit n=1 Tax=Roseibium aestuarii TaxID=2600299 RepID=A0ABW4K1H1_9HYPH|nr:HlyD family efflux transporter periplasmic adaptor subunit [Roseibium aestuarii]
MRFLARGLVGLILLAITVGAVGFGVWRLVDTLSVEETRRRPPVEERSYSVNVARLEPETVVPVTVVYGQIRSWRNLEVRASSEGRLVEVSQTFRDGEAVRAGDLLLKIDPADAQSGLLDAKAALADAEAQKAEAEEAIGAAEQELEAARKQLELRRSSLDRQRQLLDRGYATMVQVEQEELSLAAIEQSLGSRLQSIITARKKIERMELNVERARITLRDAERTLEDTELRAPFAGTLDQVDATLGRRVGTNDALAVLIDPTALEASFTLSTAEFSRFLDDAGRLIKAPVKVELDLGGRAITVTGHLDRAAARVAEGDAGRQLFATLEVGEATILRPGDFVTLRVEEPTLTNVARVPAAAVNAAGEMLLLDADQRLEEHKARILRRLGDEIVLADVPFGRSYVTERLPQLGAGLKVSPRGADAGSAPEGQDGQGRRPVAESGGGAQELVALDPARREALIAKVNSRPIPDERKAEILGILKGDSVPRSLIDRLENGGRGQRG